MRRTNKRIETLSNLLGDSIEGSIDYWAQIVSVKKVDDPTDVLGWRYDSAVIRDDEGETHTINLNTIAKGINALSAINSPRWDDLRKFNRTNGDEGDYDACDCDAIVQMALYGEIVYS